MNFVSLQFIIFLLVTWIAFLNLPLRMRPALLLLASYIFYASWSLPFLLIILVSTSTDYFASKFIYSNPSQMKRKIALCSALSLNLLILGFFKYCNFFLSASCSLFSVLHVHHHVPAHLDILLPLGISYYTFEAISYLVDTYRGEKPSRSWLEYNFYIMYFPHLISGPIIRFNELSPQYRAPLVNPSIERITKGIELLILGYAYKVMIANNCAAIADPIFKAPGAHSALCNYVGTLAFTTQVYFDFMGYTHIARGASLLFNIELPLNFNHPFNASNISNFWERWQMSLTRWIRDYIFIPLGGTRRQFPRVLLNLFLIMFICGVWHGAGWRYVIWGAYYGLAVVLYFVYKHVRKNVFKEREDALLNNRLYSLASTLLTFSTVAVACVIFRADRVEDATAMLSQLGNVTGAAHDIIGAMQLHELRWLSLAVILLTCCFVGPWAERLYYRSYTLPVFLRVQIATACALGCWLMSSAGSQPFIYFEF